MIIYRPPPATYPPAASPTIGHQTLSSPRRESTNRRDALTSLVNTMTPAKAANADAALNAFQLWLGIPERADLADQLMAASIRTITALLAAYRDAFFFTTPRLDKRVAHLKVLAWVITRLRRQRHDRQDPVPDVLTISDLERLWLAAANGSDPRGRARNLALLGLLINPQFHPREILGITCDDCRRHELVTVRRSGDGAPVAVSIGNDTSRALVQWMLLKPGGATGPLFLSGQADTHTRPVTLQTISQSIRSMGLRINRRVTPARIHAAARVACRARRLDPHQLQLPDVSLPFQFPPPAP